MADGVVLLALATAAVWLSSWLIVASLGLRRTTEILVGVAVVVGAQVVGLSLLVGGLLRAYRPVPLTVSVGLLAVAALVTALSPVGRPGLRVTARTISGTAGEVARQGWRHPLLVILGLYVSAQYVLRAAMSVRLPIMDGDALAYHLTAPATWVVEGRVQHGAQILWTDTFPLSIEAIMGWPMVFLHGDAYVSVARLPFYLLGALAVAGIARELGAQRSAATLAGLAFLATPVVFVEVFSGRVDVAATSFAAAAVYLALGAFSSARLEATPSGPIVARLLLVGLALGVAVGGKQTGIAYVVLLAVFTAIGAHRMWKRSHPDDSGATVRARDVADTGHVPAHAAAHAARRETSGVFIRRCLAALLLPVVALSGYWYLDTWIRYGSPFHPVAALGFPGRDASEFVGFGMPDQVRDAPLGMIGGTLRSWLEDLGPDVGYSLAGAMGGYGAVWLLVVVPLAGYAVYRVWRRGPRHRWGVTLLVAAALVGPLVASPAPWWTRVNLNAPVFGIALAAVGLTALPRSRQLAVSGVAVALVLWTGWLSVSRIYPDPPLSPPVGLADVVGRIAAPTRPVSGGPYLPLDRLPNGTTIAVIRNHTFGFTYPLIGADLRRHVVVVERPTTPADLHRDMTARGVRYVLLESRPPWDELNTLVRADDTHFRQTTGPHEPVDSAFLYEAGNFPSCPTRQAKLTLWSAAGPADAAGGGFATRVTARLLDGCGRPLAYRQVELWRGPPDAPVWTRDVLVSQLVTGDDGSATWADDSSADAAVRFFARYAGDGLLPATASDPITVVRPTA